MAELGAIATHETVLDGTVASYAINEIYHVGQSIFQKVHVVSLETFGRALLLDDKMQSTSADEWIYHEALVMPALLTHPNPKKVLICGGGEGGTARQVLRLNTVERCVMVDIDEVVVNTSKQYLESYHQNVWSNPRFELIIGDAKKFLIETEEKFDVIIADLADPVEDNPCYMLYTVEFYTMLRDRLAPGGIFVTQSGPCGLFTADEVCLPILNTLSKVFKYSHLYHEYVPAFFDHYGFTIVSDTIDLKARLTPQEIDERIEQRIDATHEINVDSSFVGAKTLRSFDGNTYTAMYLWPKWLKRLVAANDEIITDANPKFIV